MNHRSETRRIQLPASKWTSTQNKAQEYLQEFQKYPTPNKVKYTVPYTQSKTTKPVKKQKDMIHDK